MLKLDFNFSCTHQQKTLKHPSEQDIVVIAESHIIIFDTR